MMEGRNLTMFATLMALQYLHAESTIFSWSAWTQTRSKCTNEQQSTRSRLHMDPEHRYVNFERFSMNMDASYDILTNVALHQPASMSSQLEEYSADLLTDGVTITDMYFGSCAQTKMDKSPWFRIDLEKSGMETYVEEVIIYNRFDCCSDRANNLKITIGDDPSGHGATECNVRKDMNVRLARILCAKPTFGRYLHIRVPGPQILHLCEVQALGGRFQNLALGKISTSLDPDAGYPMTRLTDGHLNTGDAENAGHQEIPWFKIDLGAELQVYLVRLYIGRGTICIENSVVHVGTGRDYMHFCGVASPSTKIAGPKVNYLLKCTLKGRYVMISKTFSSNLHLSISEAEVFGLS